MTILRSSTVITRIVAPSEFCSENLGRSDTSCNGNGCCKANMPDRYQQIVGVKIDDNNTETRGGCKVAFLTDEEYFLSNGSDTQSLRARGYVTVELRWFIHTANRSLIGSLGCKSIQEYQNLRSDYREHGVRCVCDNNTSSYASCSCTSGYEGNPYLLGECKG
ncbi:Wall-associated receptor kinase-like 10 [Cardamine amara subsp. amara]|uniref:Wall-associated receptor kinase-like 10 n=1 Tax=Cardamine amara subsp. amara TaxID=228776 RepID=A0ABD1B8F7_CARAN